jgi:hypothetical protein
MQLIRTNSDRRCCTCLGQKLAYSSTPHLITMLTTSVKLLLKVSQPTNDDLVFLVPVFTLRFSYSQPALSSVNLVPLFDCYVLPSFHSLLLSLLFRPVQ